MSDIPLEDLTFLVLCGGAGRRMAGKDKPLETFRGRPLVDHVLDTVPPRVNRLLSANRNIETYATRGRVVQDLPDYSGPLAGVLAGLEACSTRWILISPGDTPVLPHAWWEEMTKGNMDVRVARDPQRQQHLHLLLNTRIVGNLRQYLERGGYSAHGWLDETEHEVITFKEQFVNINTLEELNETE